VDFCWQAAGPLVTRTLADWGAEVIKIETAVRLDRVREYHHPPTGATVNTGRAGTVGASYRQKELPTNQKKERLLYAGENPPDGVVIYYWLKDKAEGDLMLMFTDESGQLIREFTSKKEEERKDDPRAAKQDEEGTEPHPTKEAGMNRFVWNLRYSDAIKIPGNKGRAGTEQLVAGPQVAPGAYNVELKVGDQTRSQSFNVLKDPRVSASDEDLIAQRDLLLQVRDKLSETHDTVLQIRHIREQANAWAKYVHDNVPNAEAIKAAAKKVSDDLCAIEDELIQIRSEDPRSFPTKLNTRLAALSSFADSADSHPPQQVYDVFNDLSQRIDEQIARYRQMVNEDIAAFNKLCRESGVEAILPKVKTDGK